ncbi:hypothetical protein pEaSNUABM5_00073 [Erwinia phage pEa_SNUABM_5]|uniref:Uncharacterized protein n=1 Tax=Erwinia phage pEa_SNUABM_5 TaxID=2797313 RepID=A0A7T8EPD3_9CAUD|nr:hypothetical protein MPK73_gp073 [Erwinia phage pEa_SNUABM_5]QQO90215.1 hypothetical protein pEaSNUABM5_00073 [Erwinia phage pEa_SNUABM_5]
MLDNTAKSIAERAWAGEILLPDTAREFYAALTCDVRMPPELSFASTVVTYIPTANSSRRVTVSTAYTFGHAHDSTVLDVPERIGKSVEAAYTQALQQFYLQPKIELLNIAGKFIGRIRAPIEGERMVIRAESQAHLFALCNRLHISAATLERVSLMRLLEGVLMQINQQSTQTEPVAVLLFAGFQNFTIIGSSGMEKRLADVLDITPLLSMMTIKGHPNIDSDVRKCIKNIEAHNNKEG